MTFLLLGTNEIVPSSIEQPTAGHPLQVDTEEQQHKLRRIHQTGGTRVMIPHVLFRGEMAALIA